MQTYPFSFLLRSDIKKKVGTRSANSHKGMFGHVLIIAGSKGMCGAALLSAAGALRSGAGLVTLAVPETIHDTVAGKIPEVMTLGLTATKSGTVSFAALEVVSAVWDRFDAVLIGPGLSREKETSSFVEKVIEGCSKPLVIDADGINAIEGNPDILLRRKGKTVVTPHPKEYLRLFGVDITKENSRISSPILFSLKFGVTIVLKGHKTVVADHGCYYINSTGNPGLATGGSGDVLAGMIVSLLGQRCETFHAACFGVYLHGLAADYGRLRKGVVSLLPTDVIDYIPHAFKRCGVH